MGRMADSSLAEFAGHLAAREPAPGGGGAAAYVGALAAALCSMAGEFTSGKKRYAAYEQDVRRILAEMQEVRVRLVELVDEDATGFQPLSRAYAMPKTDPARAEAIERSTKEACKAPLETMELVCRTIELLEEMEQKGSRMMLCDVGCGALFARAALEAASLNVFANTGLLADGSFAEETEARCDQLLSEYGPRAEAVERRVMDHMRGGA